MKTLFTDAGRQALREFAHKDMLCLFDFDGTLAPLELHPDRVSMPLAVQDKLRQLQQRSAVGIVTGRSLADLRRRLVFEPDYLIGNHGIEGLPGWERGARSFERICEGWQQQLQGFLSTLGSDVWIEDKRYSLSLHFLRAAHRAGIAQALTLQCGQLDPQPRVIAGKAVLNLLPPGARDKGGAVDELMKLARASRALYAGDDVTDEQVFLLDREDLFTIHVGVGDDSAARYVIPDHASVLPLLGLLINCLSGSRDRAPNRRISAR